jgi:hypothetical protein
MVWLWRIVGRIMFLNGSVSSCWVMFLMLSV